MGEVGKTATAKNENIEQLRRGIHLVTEDLSNFHERSGIRCNYAENLVKDICGSTRYALSRTTRRPVGI